MSGALALQQAMRAALVADATLTALLGGPHVYGELPRAVPPSYVEFTAIDTRDWSTADAPGFEHFVALAVRSAARGPEVAQQACAAIAAALDGRALTLAGHRLVNLSLVFWSVAKAGQSYGASLRFRAATEPL